MCHEEDRSCTWGWGRGRGGGGVRQGVRGLTREEERVVRIPGRVLLRLEQRIKVPETAVSTSLSVKQNKDQD